MALIVTNLNQKLLEGRTNAPPRRNLEQIHKQGHRPHITHWLKVKESTFINDIMETPFVPQQAK